MPLAADDPPAPASPQTVSPSYIIPELATHHSLSLLALTETWINQRMRPHPQQYGPTMLSLTQAMFLAEEAGRDAW